MVGAKRELEVFVVGTRTVRVRGNRKKRGPGMEERGREPSCGSYMAKSASNQPNTRGNGARS